MSSTFGQICHVIKHCFRIRFELLVNAFKEDFHFNSKRLCVLIEIESCLTTLLSPLESWSYILSVSFLPSRPSRPTIKKVWFSVSAIKIIRTGTPVSKTTWLKKKNRDSLISISSPLQQPPQFLPQRFCFVPSVETWRWKLCDLRGWFYNYRSDTPPSDTITENFILLLSFLIKDFCTSETRLKLYNLRCLGIFSGLRRNAR